MNNNNTTNSLEEFSIILREHERKTFSKFVCIKSDKAFTEAKFTPNERMKIHWNGAVPHFYIGRRVYACHQGKDTNLYQKKRYAEKRDSKDHDFTEHRKLVQPTKKLDCPVVINVSRVLSLPRYKVDKLTNWEKVKMSTAIKEKVKNGEEIVGENLYTFNLPDDSSHQNHIVGLAAAVTETTDPKVRSKIKELDRGSIRNAVKKEIKWSKIDFENTNQLVNETLTSRKSKKSKLISECNSTIRSLQSAMWLLEDQHLDKIKSGLQLLYKEATLLVTTGQDTALPMAIPNKSNIKTYPYAELPKPAKKKVKRFGLVADAKGNNITLLNNSINEVEINISTDERSFNTESEVETTFTSISPKKKKKIKSGARKIKEQQKL